MILLLVVVLGALLYLRGWLRAAKSASTRIEPWRAGGLVFGLLIIWIAAGSRLAACDAGSLTIHMVQHLLLQTIAPPLILLGEPARALRYGMPRPLRRAILDGVSRWPRARRVGSTLAQPAVCWVAATVTLLAWHVPAVFALAVHAHAWHAFEHASFLATGFLFWWPVVLPWPSPPTGPTWSTVLYLFLATLPCDILSGFLVFSERVAYPVYLSTRSAPDVLGDQQCAGALMWTVVTLVYLVAGSMISARLLAPQRGLPRGEVV